MKKVKGLLVLDTILAVFEEDVMNSIALEMTRIDRRVELSELEYIPFNEQVCPYVNAIGIDAGVVIVATSFRHLYQKPLWDFISDLEINHRELVSLLGFLKLIPGANGELGSVRQSCKSEFIFYSGREPLDWICVCGNHGQALGFYPCDVDGDDLDSRTCLPSEALYRCGNCGRIINRGNLKIVGLNLNPQRAGNNLY